MAVKDTEINKLNDAWIAQGQKVSDLNDKLNAAVLDDSFDEKQFNDLKGERDNAVARRDALHSQLDEARRAHDVVNMDPKNQQPLNNSEKSMKTKFVDDFKAMMRNDPKIMNILTSSEDDSGNAAGLTIPDDIQTLIHQLVRQFDSLEQYVNVEKVTTSKGSRVWEKWTDVTPLTDLDDESAAIGDNDDPQLKVVKYLIHRYAGISTVTNSLLKDTAENILAWLSQWIAKKVVVTRNTKIIAAMNDMPKKPSITSFDDVIHTINTAVDPAIKTTSFVMTNTSGLDILTRVTDGVGRPMLQPDPKQPDQYLIKGKTVVEIADRWLPNGGTSAAPTYPFYFGDLKQAVTLFDRESMSLLSTNIGGGAFEHDQTKVRVIDRFDVQPTDTEAFVAGSFTNITNATPTKSTTTDGATK
ncbi:phage major capsid protein [Lactiplantibacillus plantarum]|uniref:phage major capsid protein n=1 Tax=Lactiplantibacillus plantarum TaxID=1590 RepID=UPI002181FCE5|nr:phage major capsid protein [Lactiplantibacillus plantarum]MCS8620212.1 phage major capsid protein [Lactiplantibacillus plantarum]MCT3214972.1 phage major capsid protein [Lactiplantibacillus plantarum]MCT3272022.1 phage major capsid protein [Lactiplantibacillus plantarum]